MDEPEELDELLAAIEADDRKTVARALDDHPGLITVEVDGEYRLLHYAAWQGAEKVARLLLKRGADLNARGERQWTPLHYAVFHSQPKLVRLLLANGADPNLRDDSNYTPVHIAARRFEPEGSEMANALLKAGASLDLQAAVRLGRTDDVQRLLRDDPESIRTAANAADLLSDAVFRDDLTLIRLIAEAGADPNAVGREPHCLVYALSSSEQRTRIINYLLDHGADPDFRPAPGIPTARETAAEAGDKKALALFKRNR